MVHTAFRVFNAAKDRVLIFRYKKTKVWSLPVAHSDIHPAGFVDFVSDAIVLGRAFELLGFIPIMVHLEKEAEWNEETNKYEQVEYNFKVYDLQYQGVVRPKVSPSGEKLYDCVAWSKQEDLLKMGFINRITKAFYLNFKSKSLINQG